MKKAALILAVLALAVFSPAQQRAGTIFGRIVDVQGKPLSRVTVTLSGPSIGSMKTVTDETGLFRYPSIYPGRSYSVKAERIDFKTVNRADIIVTFGATTEVNLTLEAGKIEEQVTSKAGTPAVDAGRMTESTVIGREELQTLPTARDPWVILQLVPAVMIDRENVGGSESGQQSSFVTKGDNGNGANNIWTLDGIDVTDPAALGNPALFFDFDTFEELSVTTGGAADVTVQTGGIALNMVTRRGGNRTSASARFYLTDHSLQSDNLTSVLRGKGVYGTNRIQQIKDFGASVGGPIVKDRIWWWGSYGVQDIFNYTIYDTRDQSLLSNYSFKLNAQPFPGNRFEALVTSGAKERYGWNASLAKPEGDHLAGKYSWGNPILKIQDEQAIGKNLYFSLKYSFNDVGYITRPMVDETMSNPVTVDVESATYVPFSSSYGRSWDWSSVSRPRKNIQFMTTYFHDSLLGVSHEFKAGFETSVKKSITQSGYAQNFEVRRNFTEPLIDLGEGLVIPPAAWQRIQFGRETRDSGLAKQASAYLQDTLSKGRFTLMLGLRFDRQTPSTGAYTLETVKGMNAAWASVFDTASMNALNTSLPQIAVRAINPKYHWNTWSPRIGLSWDISGDGKNIAKLTYSEYGDIMPVGAYTPQPLGLGGGMGFWWNDASGDGKVQLAEIFWQYSSTNADHPYGLYGLYESDGTLTDAANAALVGGFESDAYLAGNYRDFDWANPTAVNYDNLTTFYRSDVDPDAKSVKTSPRTREIMLFLERELRPDLAFSVNTTYRRYDNFDWAKAFYPADIYPGTPDLVVDNPQTWYTPAGTIPASVVIGGVTYSLGDAAGRTWYLPSASYPGTTPYRMIDKSAAYRTYFGLDLIVTKRLSNRWFLNASVTLQDQRVHWKGSYIDPTNKWALDGQPFGNWSAGSQGKTDVQMYSRWLAKVSALYQLPLGIDVSGTLNAREGWRIPTYVTLAYSGNDPWPGLYKSNTIYIQLPTKGSLPNLYNLNLRIEKKIAVGTGKMYFMADVFNVFNSATVNRAYDAYYGVYYVNTGESAVNPYNSHYNEILNPRVWRLGLRFEF
ncbi:MAG: carboxypeptidase regulatory-like domain-containing protein [Candidatus Aminicenantes bacterium]|nr:carboxypeptidase regulatory-like domain-containing protein [Candidatus Aminicenantes bacterium]